MLQSWRCSTPRKIDAEQWRATRSSEVVDRARAEHTPIYLAPRGRRVAAVIDADGLDGISELAGDMAGIRAAGAARAEMRATRETSIPWEQVRADLAVGITRSREGADDGDVLAEVPVDELDAALRTAADGPETARQGGPAPPRVRSSRSRRSPRAG